MSGWDWPVAVAAILSMWLLGNKRRSGWIVKGLGQAGSVPLNASQGLWAFALLGVIGAAMSSWNWWKWGKNGRKQV